MDGKSWEDASKSTVSTTIHTLSLASNFYAMLTMSGLGLKWKICILILFANKTILVLFPQ